MEEQSKKDDDDNERDGQMRIPLVPWAIDRKKGENKMLVMVMQLQEKYKNDRTNSHHTFEWPFAVTT
eukprot:3620018-Ditylum_brightwellii.AAC.1